jgi:hypothetical protein
VDAFGSPKPFFCFLSGKKLAIKVKTTFLCVCVPERAIGWLLLARIVEGEKKDDDDDDGERYWRCIHFFFFFFFVHSEEVENNHHQQQHKQRPKSASYARGEEREDEMSRFEPGRVVDKRRRGARGRR